MLCVISIKTLLCSAIFTSQYYNEAVQFFECLSTKSLKVIFFLVSFHLIMTCMVRINVLVCWCIFFECGQYHLSVLCFLC